MKQKTNTAYVLGISLVAAMGGLLFGYDWVVIGGAKPFYEQFFGIAGSAHLQGWAVSVAIIGCMLGAITAGSLSEKYGRKKLLILASVLFTLSALGTGLANDFTPFIIYRFIGGVGIGLASTISPMYIAEVAPAHLRGRLVALNQLTIVVGILLAQVANWQIAQEVPNGATSEMILNSWNGQTGWRWMFWAELIPAGLFFVLAWFVPESPRWLAKAGFRDKAFVILEKVAGTSHAKGEMVEIDESLSNSDNKVKFSEAFKGSMLPIVIIGMVVAALQQWCGINVIFMYAEEIFSAAGYSLGDMFFSIVITGTVNVVFTFAAMALVDTVLGRKTLMLIGFFGLALIYLVIGYFYNAQILGLPILILVVSAIAVYAMTLAPVTWVLLSEIFPNRIRGLAMAISTFSLWTASALLTYFFPKINKAIGAAGSFWIFSAICFFGVIFIWRKLIETKGKSLEEVEKEFLKKSA